MLANPSEFQGKSRNFKRIFGQLLYLREPYTHVTFVSLYWTSEKCWIFAVTLLMRPRIALLCEWGEQMGANAKPSQFSSSSQAAQSLSKATTNCRLSRIALRRICCCPASICGLDQISLIYLWAWSDQSVCLRAQSDQTWVILLNFRCAQVHCPPPLCFGDKRRAHCHSDR